MKLERITLCCGEPMGDDFSPLKLRPTGAVCSLCGEPYLLELPIICENCGCTEMLCGHNGAGCTHSDDNE